MRGLPIYPIEKECKCADVSTYKIWSHGRKSPKNWFIALLGARLIHGSRFKSCKEHDEVLLMKNAQIGNQQKSACESGFGSEVGSERFELSIFAM